MKRTVAILILLGCVAGPLLGGAPEVRENPWLAGRRVGAELAVIEDDTLRLASDLPAKAAHVFFRLACDARAVFRRQFRVPRKNPLWTGRCTIYLFKERETYIKFAEKVHGLSGMAGTTAYTRPTRDKPTIVIARGKHSNDEVYRAAIHELAHVFLELYYNDTTLPTWLSEGVAQWFEFRHKPRTSREGKSKKLVKTALTSKAQPRLKDMLARRIEYTDDIGYAMAWSFTSFLLDAYHNRRFHQFVCSLKDGIPQQAALEKAFGVPLDKLERQWLYYVKRKY